MIFLSISVILVTAALVAGAIMWAWSEVLLDRIFQDMVSKEAIAQDKCLIRETWLVAPGAAQILRSRLIVRDVAGRRYDIPLEEVATKKDKTAWLPPWFGKRVLHLKTTQTRRLALGVARKGSAAWDALSARTSAQSDERS